MNTTKSKLISSLLILTLCVTMFVGSTYAWFTDSAVSAGNKIVAGDLDVELYLGDGTGNEANYVNISGSKTPIFGKEDSLTANNNTADTLWEPGKTQVAYLKIANEGSLDLKYVVNLDVKDDANDKDLYKAMEYAIIRDAKTGVASWATGTTPNVGLQRASGDDDVELKAGEEHYFALAVHMKEEAGNEYMNGYINFDIVVQAAQLASEADAFDDTYDTLATYGVGGHVISTISDALSTVDSTGTDHTFTYENPEKTIKVSGYVNDPSQPAPDVDLKPVPPTDSVINAVADGSSIVAYDIDVTNYKDDVTVDLFIGKGLQNVQLYHEGTFINSTYNAETGYVNFVTDSFSVYDIIFNVAERELPSATVTSEGTQSITGAQGLFGSNMPNPLVLDATFKFVAPHTGTEAAETEYADWEADYVITMNKDLEEGAAILAGQYDSYGEGAWFGFYTPAVNGGEANRLLKSVGAPWTYEMVCSAVQTFKCGVKNVNIPDDEGYVMTVELKLYEKDENGVLTGKEYTVTTITYEF